MSRDLYMKMVDLYAGRELTPELEDQLEWASFGDSELSHEMATLRRTVDLLKESDRPEFTEEIHQRILAKIIMKGADIQVDSPTAPVHLQLYLPIDA